MPLNMNIVGTGSGIGYKTDAIALYADNSKNVNISTSVDTTSYKFNYNDDFIYYSNLKPKDDPLRKYRYAGNALNSPNDNIGIDNATYINDVPYFWTTYYSDNQDKPTGYATAREEATLYKFNMNDDKHSASTYTKISLPKNLTYIFRNESLNLGDSIIVIGSSRATDDGEYGYVGLSVRYMKIYLYRDDSGNFTELINLATALSKLNTKSTYCYNAFVLDGELLLIMDTFILSINLSTLSVGYKCKTMNKVYTFSKNPLMSGLSVIIKDTIYSMIIDTPSYGNSMPYLEKYNVTFTDSGPTLTTISTDVLGTAYSKDVFYNTLPDYFMCIISRQEINHYMIGMAIVDRTKSAISNELWEGTNEYAGTLLIHKNTLDIYVNDSGNIVESKPFKTMTKFTRWQAIAYIAYGSFSVRNMLWRSCLSFHMNPVTSSLSITVCPFGLNDGYVNVFHIPSFNAYVSNFKSSDYQIINAYLYKNDRIYTSGSIVSISTVSGTIDRNKYTIPSTGDVTIKVASVNGKFPSTVITDKYGNIIFIEIEKIKTTSNTYRWCPLHGMYINDSMIESSTRNQTIDMSSYPNRLYISMKGV